MYNPGWVDTCHHKAYQPMGMVSIFKYLNLKKIRLELKHFLLK